MAYEEIRKSVMKEFYMQLIPHLSIENKNVRNFRSEKYLQLKRELDSKIEENRLLLEKLGQKVQYYFLPYCVLLIFILLYVDILCGLCENEDDDIDIIF